MWRPGRPRVGFVFDRIEISVLPAGSRFPAQLRVRVNGEDVVVQAVGHEVRGPLASDALLIGSPNSLHATSEERRVELGEPECTGGCCGFLTVVVQRVGGIVQWSGWQVPSGGTQPPEFHFDASQYDAELCQDAIAVTRSRP